MVTQEYDLKINFTDPQMKKIHAEVLKTKKITTSTKKGMSS